MPGGRAENARLMRELHGVQRQHVSERSDYETKLFALRPAAADRLLDSDAEVRDMSRGSGWQQNRQNPASQADQKVDTVTDPHWLACRTPARG